MTWDEKVRKFIGTEKKYCLSCEQRIYPDDKENKPIEYKDGYRCKECAQKYKKTK